MPLREPSAFVWDVLDACRTIEATLKGADRSAYVADQIRRLAIERLLITIGEAINQLDRIDSNLAAELGDVAQIVAFRNVLVHGYWKLDHERVWDVLDADVPRLRAVVEKIWSRFAPNYPEE